MKLTMRLVGEEIPWGADLLSFHLLPLGAKLLRARTWPKDNPDSFSAESFTYDDGGPLQQVMLNSGTYVVEQQAYNPEFEDGILLVFDGENYFIIEECDLYHPRFKDKIHLMFNREHDEAT